MVRGVWLGAVVLAGRGFLLAQDAGSSKVSRALRERHALSAPGEKAAVFIALSYQPQEALLAGLRMEALRDRSLLDTENFRLRARSVIERAIRDSQDRMESTLLAGGATHTSRYTAVNLMAAEVPLSMLDALEADPRVAEVFPVRIRRAQSLTESVSLLGAPAFWAQGWTGGGVSVALLDTGVKQNHPAFAGRNIVSRIFLNNVSSPSSAVAACFDDDASSSSDLQGHGTHLAGILMSQGSPGFTSFFGVARGLGTLFNVKVGFRSKAPCSSGAGDSDDRDLLAGLEWVALNTQIKIVNISFTAVADTQDDPFTRTVDRMSDLYDIFIAAAAGNGGASVNAPGNGYNVTTVANWVTRGTISPTSNRGPTPGGLFKPDIAAPGSSIVSTNNLWDASPATFDDYIMRSGTSMAAPHIAGSAALLQSAGVLDVLEQKAILLNATGAAAWAPDRGWGFADLNLARRYLAFRDARDVPLTGYRMYRMAGVGGPATATLTWNRHVDTQFLVSRFNNLDLIAYRLHSGALLAASSALRQNVEKVSFNATEDVVLKVDTVAGNPSFEYYGIAATAALTRVNGPGLTVSCSQSLNAFEGSVFVGSCTVSNPGDLPVFGVILQLGFPNNVSGLQTYGVGAIAAGGSSRVEMPLNAVAAGPATVNITANGDAYGESFRAASSFAVFISTGGGAAPAAPVGPFPVTGAVNVPVQGILAWTSAAGASSYDVLLSTVNPPTQVWATNVRGVSASYAGLAPGQLYFWRVVAKNSVGSTQSAVFSFTTAAAVSSDGLRFVPMAPCRLVDTRGADGELGGPMLAGGVARSFPLASHHCMGGARPAAYALNVGVMPEGSLSYVTVFPSDQPLPLAATLNSLDGRIKTNAAIVAASADGSVSVFATQGTHLTIDVMGYFVAGEGLAFYPLTPCRVVDTREGSSLEGMQSRSFPIRSSPCGIPASARAYSLNATVAPKTESFGALSLWPAGQEQPVAVTLNAVTGAITANAAIVAAGANGEINAWASDAADLIVDVNGYFGPPGQQGALTYRAVSPCRVSDTRNSPNGPLAGPALTAGAVRDIPVASSACSPAVLASARAYALHATVVPEGSLGFLSLWPAGQPQPVVATLNAVDGAITSNAAIVPASTPGGAISVLANGAGHLILDLNGIFVP